MFDIKDRKEVKKHYESSGFHAYGVMIKCTIIYMDAINWNYIKKKKDKIIYKDNENHILLLLNSKFLVQVVFQYYSIWEDMCLVWDVSFIILGRLCTPSIYLPEKI